MLSYKLVEFLEAEERKEIMKKVLSIVIAVALCMSVGTITGATAKKNAIKLNKKSITLKIGNKITLTAKNGKKKITGAKWKTSNNKIASVSQKGVVKAKGAGLCTIMASKKGFKAGVCKVTVKNKSAGNNNQDQSTQTPAQVPTQAPSQTPSNLSGSRTNPYPAQNDEIIAFQKYSFYNIKNINISVDSVIKGTEANTIVSSENMFNQVPAAGQEWRIYTFNIKYISCNSDDELAASDIIYNDYFYTQQGSTFRIYDTGTLGNKYAGMGIFDVKLYPGGSSKVVYMILTDISNDSAILRVPISAGNDYKWINLG